MPCGVLTFFKCLTLSPTVALQAEIASAEDQESLAEALFFLREPSTGSVEGDVRRLSTLINESVKMQLIYCNFHWQLSRLVVGLGLQSSLVQYKVPKEDFNFIASAALGGQADSVRLEKVIQVLEGIYDPNKLWNTYSWVALGYTHT